MSMHSGSDKEISMLDLIGSQKLILERIKRMKANYGKDARNRKTKPYILLRLDLLNEKWSTFKDTHRHIMNEFTVQDAKLDYFKNDMLGEVEELYIDFRSELEQFQAEEFGVETQNPLPTQNNHNDSPMPKLPTINLPKFNGEYQAWTSFHDLFVTLIHNNDTISDVQKLYYLKTHLTDEADQLLRHVSITDANYQTAWQSLIHRYDNKRVLVNTQLKILLNQSNLTAESSEGIKKLLDTTSECLKALQNLGVDTRSWDPIIIYLTTQNLPSETHQMWEHSISKTKDLPTFECLTEFLEARFRTLEVVGTFHMNTKEQGARSKNKQQPLKTLHTANINVCYYCQGQHNIRKCASYQQLDVSHRESIANENDLCVNCLTRGHQVNRCYSKMNCKYCNQRHHHLLHYQRKSDHQVMQDKNATTNTNQVAASHAVKCENISTSLHSNICTTVLLATAMIKINTSKGVYTLRALLDQGSQTSFITESAVQLLQLNKIRIDATIKGIGNNIKQTCKHKVKLNIMSNKGYLTIDTDAIVLRTITNLIPNEKIVHQHWPHLEGLSLADPNYLQPGRIDVLLGADVYSEILSNGLKQGPPNTPVAQNTVFGWIISGKTSSTDSQITQSSRIVNFHNRIEIDSILKRFWEIEEIPQTRHMTEEEMQCEILFEKTHSRDAAGRYIVNLPFRENEKNPFIGKSRHIAMSRFLQTEKRFMTKPNLKEDYVKCIKEYSQLKHMKYIERPEDEFRTFIDGTAVYNCYYLPHHPVIKEESSTTKLRVVFNASQPTDSGKSLNDILMTGPTIQDDLKTILFRWRLYKYAYSADIEKMYRQIGVTKEQQDYQRILWRESHLDKIKEFCLTRVTFGFTSAAYLAIRSLQQLAYDEGDKYPQVKDILLHDFYVDNVLSGADDIVQAKKQREQLISLLELGGFPLKKWSASHDKIIDDLPDDYKEEPTEREFGVTREIKTLGVLWNPNGDFFSYNFALNPLKLINTKRTAASIIAKIFDPLGWCSPVTVVGKILLQALWLIEIEWDDELPDKISQQFMNYQNSLQEIHNIKIPRWIGMSFNSSFEIHGFCDASNKAYAAVIYIKLLEETNEQKIFLLAANTKVAPIKTISLPRLELCGALLLSRLFKYYIDALKRQPVGVYAWTDSTIVLSWLNGHPNKWKCFVANRVTEIKKLMIGATWRHVQSEDNPADCASRGKTVSDLLVHDLWWSGPSWLRKNEADWPQSTFYETKEELRNIKTLTTQTVCLPSIITRYSNLNKLIRVTAYVYRFIRRCKRGVNHNTTKWLDPAEIKFAFSSLIQKTQELNFAEEIKNLQNGRNVASSSRLLKLYPFLDKNGLLRVGGRLQGSNLPYEGKHPLILDNKSFLTELIIRHTHLDTLHGGPQLTINILRQRYWILNVRNTVRYIINQCVTCVKQKGNCGQQLMGSLPPVRITESRPFSHTGIDYCGPYNIKLSKGRGTKSQKCYISLFICLSVKAVHIELVSDLTTPAFLAALKRFISRRGLPSDIYSDCGSNFIGASRVIDKDLANCIKENQEEVAENLANDNVTWHFNPPSAPNFGGLWEAGVKSTKHHLKRLLNTRLLTFEEMTTVLSQIEACLNSRPISPFTNDIEDLTAITPGHFLIGAPLKSIPEPSLLNANENHLTRWHLVQQITQHFWKRWHQEYLQHLQQRQKWINSRDNFMNGDMVLIKEQNLPSNTWLLGRIVKTYPGADTLTRVVDIKTKNGILKRPITKLCRLPIEQTKP